jgi:hypothetical protein
MVKACYSSSLINTYFEDCISWHTFGKSQSHSPLPYYNSSWLHIFNMSINSIEQQAMGGPPAKGWADD